MSISDVYHNIIFYIYSIFVFPLKREHNELKIIIKKNIINLNKLKIKFSFFFAILYNFIIILGKFYIYSVFKKCLQPCRSIVVILTGALLLWWGGVTQNAFAQVGIGFTSNGNYTGTIGSNKGGVEGYLCPKGSMIRGFYHVDKSMNARTGSTRGMTSQVGLYCTAISINSDHTISTTPVTPDGTPTVLGYGYAEPGTTRTDYCPDGYVTSQLGGYDRTTFNNYYWASSLNFACRPVQLSPSDWVQINTGSATYRQVGVNENNATHYFRGYFCPNAPDQAVSGIYRQAGGEGYDGINVYCGTITQARHSVILTFTDFAWNKTIDRNNWLIDLTQNGQLLENNTGISGANMLSYAATSDNNPNAYKPDYELYVIPGSGYGARISQTPSDVPANSYVQTGTCVTNGQLANQQDSSCVLTVTGRPDLAVGITVPDRIYTSTRTTMDITVTATNMGAKSTNADNRFALVVDIPNGWTASAVPGCTVSGQTVTCQLDSTLDPAPAPGQSGGSRSFTFPVSINSSVEPGTKDVNVHLDRSFTDNSGKPEDIDYNTANDKASGPISYAKTPALTIKKVSNDGVGTFTFTGNNGWQQQSITTTQPGMGVTGNTEELAAINTETTITEDMPANWILDNVSCTGLGNGTVTFNKNSFTLSADAITDGSDIHCTVTNQYIKIETRKTSDIGDGKAVENSDIITYTLTTVITGQSLSENLIITDTLGESLTFGTVTNAGGFTPDTSGAPILKFTLPQGTAPGTYTVSYTAKVKDDATAAASNSATTNIGTCDKCSTRNPVIIVSTSKSSDVGKGAKVHPGNTVIYTLKTVIGQGALTRTFTLTDTLSNNLTFAAVVDPGRFQTDISGAPVLKFTLPAGTEAGTYTVSYAVTVNSDATGEISNVVEPSGGTCKDCSTNNPVVVVSTSKSSDIGKGAKVQPGQIITYTLTTTVKGGAVDEDVVLTDRLGNSLAFEAVTDAGGFRPDTSGAPMLKFTLPAGTAEGTYTVSYTAKVKNDATAAASNSVTPNSGTCDNCSTNNLVVVVSTSKSSDIGKGARVHPGQIITYTLTTTVKGGAVDEDVILTDRLGDSLAFEAVTDAGGFRPDTSGAPMLKFTLPAGTAEGTYTVSYTAKVKNDATAAASNSVTSNSGTCDNCSTNNPVVVVSTSKSSDVGNGAKVHPGQIITYTLTTTVKGRAVDEDVVLTDRLGDSLAFEAVTDAGGFRPDTSGAPMLKFTLPAGTAEGTYTVSYTAKVKNDATAAASNSVTSNSGTCDDCSTNNPVIVVSTSKSSDIGKGAKVQPGQIITYTLTTTVKGGAVDEDVVLTDRLGDSLAFGAVTDAGGFRPDTSGAPMLKFTLPAGTAEGTYTVSYTAKVKNDATAAASNSVTSNSGTCDNCSTNNPLVTIRTLKSSDVGNGTKIESGSIITYTLTIVVSGGTTSENVILTDRLGDSLAFEAVTDAGGFKPDTSENPKLKFTLPQGTEEGTYKVSYTAKVKDGSIATANNSVTSNSGTCNNCLTANPIDTSILLSKALVGESGTTDGIAEAGETLTYEITITNKGAQVTDYAVQDLLDINTNFVSATNNGSHSGSTPGGIVNWTGLTVPGRTGSTDGKLVLTLQLQVINPIPEGVKQISNLVKEPDEPDPDCPSDQCVTIPAEQDKLTLVKTSVYEDTDNSNSTTPGDIISYTFKVINEGNVTVNDVAIEDPGPTFNGQPGESKLSNITPEKVNIAPGEAVTFTATYTLTAGDINNAGGTEDSVRNSAGAKGNINGNPARSNGSTTTQTLILTNQDLSISKVANLHAIRRGEQAPFTIRLTNNSNSNASGIRVVDRAPPGFRFIEDSAIIDGKKVTPTVNGRDILFENLSVPGNGYIEIQLRMLALSSAGPGEHTNTAFATDSSGKRLSTEAKAKIEILIEALFDCADVIGRVFVDNNHNGYQDEGERGIPGVRLVTARGWIITTDQNGGFNVPCAALPDQRIGSNFILKLDTRSLPTGYRLTTENPRVVRLTAGKMTKIDFGVALGRVVRLDLRNEAFEVGKNLLKQQWLAQINQLISILDQEQAILRLSYIDAGSSSKIVEKRLQWVRDFIRKRWRERRGRYRLEIETRVEVGK